MAGATPIYSFPYPESSDLVAAYPALGQDLAEDIETVIAALPGGGLVHINTTTFTATSSVSINNVFTATYDNYCISFDIQNTIGNQPLILRLRVGGVDDTTASSYVVQFLLGGGGSASALGAATNQGQISVLNLQSVHMTNLYSPFLTAQTNAITHSQSYGTSTSFISNFGFNHNQSTSYDGFTFYSGSGNMTGTVRIYGYKNI